MNDRVHISVESDRILCFLGIHRMPCEVFLRTSHYRRTRATAQVDEQIHCATMDDNFMDDTMANCARLLNTDAPIGDLGTLLKREGRPTVAYLETIGPAYRLPIPWLCFFRPDDMRPVIVQTENDKGNVHHFSLNLPCATVEKSIKNLEQALPLFEKIVEDKLLANLYWKNAMSYLKGLPLAYLTLDPLEIVMFTDPETELEDLIVALEGSDSAIPYLKDYAAYNDGVRPYPPEVLFAAAPPSYDEKQMDNSVSLDVCAGASMWHNVAEAHGHSGES
jgi:hypothetical protein